MLELELREAGVDKGVARAKPEGQTNYIYQKHFQTWVEGSLYLFHSALILYSTIRSQFYSSMPSLNSILHLLLSLDLFLRALVETL